MRDRMTRSTFAYPGAISQIRDRAMPALLAAVPLCLISAFALAADNASRGPSEVTFLCQIIVLLVCGRLMGELMERIGQPAVMGQLIAGILLGPSALGALWPALQHTLFPASPDQKAMIDAVAQLGFCCCSWSPEWRSISSLCARSAVPQWSSR